MSFFFRIQSRIYDRLLTLSEWVNFHFDASSHVIIVITKIVIPYFWVDTLKKSQKYSTVLRIILISLYNATEFLPIVPSLPPYLFYKKCGIILWTTFYQLDLVAAIVIAF